MSNAEHSYARVEKIQAASDALRDVGYEGLAAALFIDSISEPDAGSLVATFGNAILSLSEELTPIQVVGMLDQAFSQRNMGQRSSLDVTPQNIYGAKNVGECMWLLEYGASVLDGNVDPFVATNLPVHTALESINLIADLENRRGCGPIRRILGPSETAEKCRTIQNVANTVLKQE